jgi:type VI secretion system secreted protein Hcp
MALNAYLKLRGQTTGEVRGSSTLRGRENLNPVIAVSHEIVSPRDAATGLPTGKRQHRPITITKEVDKASPLLANILVRNENITEWELKFFRAGQQRGTETHYYSIRLTNASITGIRLEMLNNAYPDNVSHAVREHVTFTYQKIEWTYVDGGITAEDDWQQPDQ